MLDEADEMLDLGFREDLEFILETTPAERRTLLFSATMPKAIATLAKRYQRDALRIEVARRRDAATPTSNIAPSASRRKETEHAVVNLLRFVEAPTRAGVLQHPRGRAPPAGDACRSAAFPRCCCRAN